MAQHRYRTSALIGEWRSTREEACRDAMKAGLARPDPTQPDGVSWAMPVEIEKTSARPERPAH
jgi:hypothetical protein